MKNLGSVGKECGLEPFFQGAYEGGGTKTLADADDFMVHSFSPLLDSDKYRAAVTF